MEDSSPRSLSEDWFDCTVDRLHGPFPDSTKWNRYAGRDVLPMWVADMDFRSPPAVVAALRARVDHGVFGYGQPWPSLVDAVVEHLYREYGWQTDGEWIVWLPGLVTGLNVACRAVDGDALTAVPVYPPFLSAPLLAGRRLLTVPLAPTAGHWQWDFERLERDLTPTSRLLLLCHPHNPVGQVWSDAELWALNDFANRHGLVVCSDEIHCGLILDDGRRHRPFASLGDDALCRTVTLMAPSKTFNVPGLGCAFAVIADPGLRAAFRRAADGIVPHVNTLGLAACEAALRHAGDWHRALIDYLRGNRQRLTTAIAGMPGLSMTEVEATYLAWIEATDTDIPAPQQFFEGAGVGLSPGADFGPGNDYGRFVRLNFGCPRALLDEALARMHAALSRH